MRYVFVLLGSLLAGTLSAQKDTTETTEEKLSFAVVERLPVAPGCEDIDEAKNDELGECLQEYIVNHVAANFKYPKNARKQGVGANIYINFVVEKDASISNIQVVRGAQMAYADAKDKVKSAAKELDDEALRVISSLVFVKPAMQRGKPVRIVYTMPINAKLK